MSIKVFMRAWQKAAKIDPETENTIGTITDVALEIQAGHEETRELMENMVKAVQNIGKRAFRVPRVDPAWELKDRYGKKETRKTPLEEMVEEREGLREGKWRGVKYKRIEEKDCWVRCANPKDAKIQREWKALAEELGIEV